MKKILVVFCVLGLVAGVWADPQGWHYLTGVDESTGETWHACYCYAVAGSYGEGKAPVFSVNLAPTRQALIAINWKASLATPIEHSQLVDWRIDTALAVVENWYETVGGVTVCQPGTVEAFMRDLARGHTLTARVLTPDGRLTATFDITGVGDFIAQFGTVGPM